MSLSTFHPYTQTHSFQSEVKMWRRKFEEVSGELDGLGEVKKTASSLQKEIESLINRNKVTICICLAQWVYMYVRIT